MRVELSRRSGVSIDNIGRESTGLGYADSGIGLSVKLLIVAMANGAVQAVGCWWLVVEAWRMGFAEWTWGDEND